jgi:superfamily II DNA or RNA helicase
MGPKHHKSKLYVNQGLFNDLKSFGDLEKRITKLPSTTARGEAFEVFAEAYLNTQKISMAEQIWPFEEIPETIKRKLSLDTNRDMGVDGVFKSTIDIYCAYQVKFRTGRGGLKWEELSTFMGLSDQVEQRVLFTNCERLPQLMEDRSGFYCIHGNDLDRLEEKDFELIHKWLLGTKIERSIKKPRKHQIDAVNALVDQLKIDRNAMAIMACGTGKSLVALWVAERLKIKSVLVFVPSLALVRQLLHEWMRETSWSDVLYLCVCSDPSVVRGSDDLVVHQADLDFPVTTDESIIRRFLNKKTNAIKLVFTTYQSTKTVCKAVNNHFTFDLAIFDEAHRTAGKQGRQFSAALSENNISINKRIFFTATPRHYDIRKKDEEGDPTLVYSMDRPDVYGEIAYSLSFTQAASRNIICDYKVIVTIVTSEMVTDELLRKGVVLVDGHYIKARQIANQIALRKAIEKYGLKKVFTFHKSVASAQSFTSYKPEGVGTLLPSFETFHVNGRMLTSRRDKTIREFTNANYAIMSNARCLTEGVDVPAVDMVAFMAPKRSKVDIIQATGRAMRKAPYKENGYILVPLFIEQEKGESVDEAKERTDFSEVWDVLQALKEQDEVLKEIIRQMREEKGQKKGFDDFHFKEKIEILGPEVEFDKLSNSIIAACIDNLGALWDERFGEIKTYFYNFGHCNVPAIWTPNQSLGNWVRSQRRQFKAGVLAKERIEKLESIGFSWELYSDLWEEKFMELLEYKNRYQNCEVPKKWPENPSLANWVRTQRKLFKNGNLQSTRVDRLNAISFTWRILEKTWEDYYDDLVRYNREYKTLDIDVSFYKLRRWFWDQIRKFKNNSINAERKIKLEQLGLDFALVIKNFKLKENTEGYTKAEHHSWYEYYNELTKYLNKYGDCNVPARYKCSLSLGTWVVRQRQLYKYDELENEKIDLLNKLSFLWHPGKTEWEERYFELLEYQENNGDCNVSQKYDNIKLSRFVTRMRRIYKNAEIDNEGNLVAVGKGGSITNEQKSLLDDIGFTWSLRGENNEMWEIRYYELIAYYEKYGNADVPARWVNNPQLSAWVDTQRRKYKTNNLNIDRITKLESINFKWSMINSFKWYENYSTLVEILAQQDNKDIFIVIEKMPNIKNWLYATLRKYISNNMSAEKRELLDNLNINWEKYYDKVIRNKDYFNELNQFRLIYGHCNVPRSHENKQLVYWVTKIRQKYREHTLGKKALEELENLGFDWDPVANRWELRYQELTEYKIKHGDCNVPKYYPTNQALSHWVKNQKGLKEKLSSEKIKLLNDIGFIWKSEQHSSDNIFDQRIHELLAYKEITGHMNVSQLDSEFKKLGRWLNDQRVRKSRNQLSTERIKRLEQIGIVWNVPEVRWEQRLIELKVFYEQYGHFNVPKSFKEYPKLKNWVSTLRKNKPSQEKFKKLKEIGYDWDLEHKKNKRY